MIRVLMICPELPTADCPGSMAPAGRQIESLRKLGIHCDVVDMRGIPKLKYLQVIPKVWRLAKTADLVHAHFGNCGWLARVQRRIPLVLSFMGDDLLGTPINENGDRDWFSKQMVKWNCRLATKANGVIVKSPEMAEVISHVPSTVIPNGVDMKTFCPMDRKSAQQKLGLDDGRLKVLFPGDPGNPRKGHKLASASVAHAAEILNRPIDLIPLWGVNPEDVSIYMNACGVMVMTSLIEGSPNVVKEAMSCNVPVVGVQVGDVDQLLDNVSGCAFCNRDAVEIGEHVARLLTNPGSIGARQAIIDRQLDAESVARRIVAVYENVLGQRIEITTHAETENTLPVSQCAAGI